MNSKITASIRFFDSFSFKMYLTVISAKNGINVTRSKCLNKKKFIEVMKIKPNKIDLILKLEIFKYALSICSC